ncbi:MAG: methyltransferase family protein [Planctomycetota bacterium]
MPSQFSPPPAESPVEVPAASEWGAGLFERRRWIHPPFFLTALWLGGAQAWGIAAGGVLLFAYLAVRLWSCRSIRGAARVHALKAQEQRVLVEDGPFAYVRNPLYLANCSGLMGTVLMLGPIWLAPCAGVAALAWYHSIVLWEEGVLERLYPASYQAYCLRVPRWWPRIPRGRPARSPSSALTPAPETAVQPRPAYPWRRVLRVERGALLTVAVVAALAVLRS